jgi:hypothetical protein
MFQHCWSSQQWHPERVSPYRADFFAALRALVFGVFFFADLPAALEIGFRAAERPFTLPKMFSQLSEYCLVAPTRVMVIGDVAPLE